MGNCLFTKLKVQVPPTIGRLGQLSFSFDDSVGPQNSLSISVSESVRVYTDEPNAGMSDTDAGLSNPVSEYTITTNKTLYFKKGTYYIDKKYNITDISVPGSSSSRSGIVIKNQQFLTSLTQLNVSYGNFYCNIKDFIHTLITAIRANSCNGFAGDISELAEISTASSFKRLTCANTGVYGNISVFENFSNIENINISTTDCVGNLSSLSELTMLKTLDISKTGIQGNIASLSKCTLLTSINVSENAGGEINELVRGMIDNYGRNSGNITCLSFYSNITLDGSILSDTSTTIAIASATQYSVTNNGVTKTYIKSGGSWQLQS